MKKSVLSASVVVLATLIAIVGCGEDSPTGSVAETQLVIATPANGDHDFNPADSIHMRFNEPVDTARFHEWFYCLDSTGHDALQDSLTGGMMGMGGMHSDSIAFYERMHDRAVGGEFHWNNQGDSCVFVPDTDLMHDTEYVMRFRTEITNHRGNRMQHMGAILPGDMLIRFRTLGP